MISYIMSINYSMKKISFFILSVFFISVFNLNASIYKGQKEYVKHCVSCHKSGQSFIVTKMQKQWMELLVDDGFKLAEIHLLNDYAKKSHDYFKGKKYEKLSESLKQFLVEYAKDSGKIPACN